MMKHLACVLAIGFGVQASSIAAVRAEWSGNASGEIARNVNADVDTDEDSVASEDLTSDSSQATASPTLNNNNIINVDTKSAANADNVAASESESNQARNENLPIRHKQRGELAYGRSDGDLEYAERHEHRGAGVGIMPMLGTGFWRGGPNRFSIANDYNFGLVLEFPMTSLFSLEAEGAYASYGVVYAGTPYSHRFDQYLGGLNGKLYLGRARFRPYIGLGMDALYYHGMSYGPWAPPGYAGRGYDQWIGAGQLLTGADFYVTDNVALGARLTYSQPLINRPITAMNGVYGAPGCEEAAGIDTGFYRALGTVKVSF